MNYKSIALEDDIGLIIGMTDLLIELVTDKDEISVAVDFNKIHNLIAELIEWGKVGSGNICAHISEDNDMNVDITLSIEDRLFFIDIVQHYEALIGADNAESEVYKSLKELVLKIKGIYEDETVGFFKSLFSKPKEMDVYNLEKYLRVNLEEFALLVLITNVLIYEMENDPKVKDDVENLPVQLKILMNELIEKYNELENIVRPYSLDKDFLKDIQNIMVWFVSQINIF